ncbi:flavodoxin [uncultured Alistipes sp.]|uniref:flavodoxin n=1 Tax=uncultured Alistipes sp. TaxID=538949 RepID=UPI002608F574|nr:flavodoxin [uncultured Alistipes sp.]
MKEKLMMTFLAAVLCMTAAARPAPEKGADGKKILVAYFSWSGNTQHVAEHIASLTGGTLFRIEPEKPYPAEYRPCTEVAKAEKEADARPAIAREVEDWEQYDTVFIGCPVWWWTAPMIINTFAESYDFKGKTVIPFCTYASTYRDETLARIVELTPEAAHLKGFGAVDRNTDGIEEWLKEIGMTE